MINSKAILTRSSKLKTDNNISSSNNNNIINTLLLAASALNDNVNLSDKIKNDEEIVPQISCIKKVLKRGKVDQDKSAKCIKLSDTSDVKQNIITNDEQKNSPEEVSQLNIINNSVEDVKNNNNNVNTNNNIISQQHQLAQQATLIFENGQSCLQFHLKPETNSNSQITLKVLPISSTSNETTLLFNQHQNINQLNNSSNNNNGNNNNNSNVTKGILTTTNTFNITSSSSPSTIKQHLQIPCVNSIITTTTQSPSQSISSVIGTPTSSSSTTATTSLSPLTINNYLNKKLDENNNQHQHIINVNDHNSNNQNNVIDNNGNNGNIYFMMQTSSSSSTNNTNELLQHHLKSQQQQINNNSNTNNNNLNNKSLSYNRELNNDLNNNNNNNIITYNNSSISSSSSSATSNSLLSCKEINTINNLNTPNINNASPNKIVRDERRRANHNEVERRRRDNINKWIVELSKVIPDCSNNQSKHGQSKGGILEKTVQYLSDIKQANQHLTNHIQCLNQIREENELLKKQNEMYKRENEYYRSKYGIKVETDYQNETISAQITASSEASTTTLAIN